MRGTPARPDSSEYARRTWEEASDVWEDFQESGKDFARDIIHGPALLRAIGPLRGRRLLDVGCGQGRFTRLLASEGARVTAIDWSRPLIRAARRRESARPLGIDYRVLDAREVGTRFAPGSFDVAVACMSFMDMPNLPRVLRGVRRALAAPGRLVFSVSHPLNTATDRWEPPRGDRPSGMLIDHYFSKRFGVTEWRMPRLTRPFDTVYWHRTFEEWFTLLRRTGFEVEHLSEPRSSRADARRNPALGGSVDLPFFLVVRCRTAPALGRPTDRGSGTGSTTIRSERAADRPRSGAPHRRRGSEPGREGRPKTRPLRARSSP